MQGALQQELRRNIRVTTVAAEYLPRQGVLLSITLNTPWLRYDDQGDPTIEFHGNISLPEIPAMVSNILQDLQINVAPYEPEALEELRDLREEQRELRMESREKRSALRATRRALVRSEDRDDKAELEAEIQVLEQELALLDQQYDTLAQDIEMHYQELRENPVAPPAPQPARNPTPDAKEDNLEEILAQAVCDYGATLKHVDSDEYLTLAVRRGRQSEYFAFEMAEVVRCNRSSINPGKLLQEAYRYTD